MSDQSHELAYSEPEKIKSLDAEFLSGHRFPYQEDIALVERQMRDSGALCARGWRYARMDGVGHWMTLEAPERVTPLLIEYLGATL